METDLLKDHVACYEALKSHDQRFDGRFFVGVSSTGIYCRPVCRAKVPRLENCGFYPSAAAAEAEGFRPCLRCRPELAPGLAPVDAQKSLARRAALLIEEELAPDVSLPRLAAALGVSERHVRRVFEAEFGVSPMQFLQTRRLLLAKSLLTDTRLPITQVAFAAGFKSVRRFNELFRSQYRLTPSDLRKTSKQPLSQDSRLAVQLSYREPYDWPRMLRFLAGRTIAGVELVENNSYQRSVRIQDGNTERHGWISISPVKGKPTLALTMSEGLLPVLPRVVARVRYLFDLDADPAAIGSVLQTMDEYKPGLSIPGIRLPGSFDAWEMTVRAVLGQQITVKAAQTLARRISEQLGTPVETPFPEVNSIFPSAASLLAMPGKIEDTLGVLGVTGTRSRCIQALARALAEDPGLLSNTGDAPEQMERLLALPGLGPWTVHYIAMRALGWPDAFPHTDYGVKKALEPLEPKAILALAEQWRPWRSYATICLWESLSHSTAKPD